MKVLGTGRAKGILWKDISVMRKSGERPRVHLEGMAARRAQDMGIETVHVAITHTRDLALATALGESSAGK